MRSIAIAQILNVAEALAIRRRGIERFGEMAVFCQGNLRPCKEVLPFPLLPKGMFEQCRWTPGRVGDVAIQDRCVSCSVPIRGRRI